MGIKKLLSNKNLIFYTGISLTFILVFLRLIFDIDVSVFMTLLMFGLTILFCDREQIITLAIICLPLSATFQYKYALLICVGVYFIKFNEDISIKRLLIPVLLMLFWEALHAFFYTTDIKEYFRGFAELILVAFVMLLPLKKFNYARFIRVFAISCIVVFTILFLYVLADNNFDIQAMFSNGYRLGINNRGDQDLGIYLNANVIGFLCNISIVGLAQLLLSRNGKIMDVAFIVLLIVFGFLTMSRAFLLCLAVITLICLCMILVRFNAKKRWIIIGSVVGAGIFAVLLVALLVPSVIQSFIQRFTEGDISGGRIDIFKAYNEHIFSDIKYLMFGIGLQDISGKMQQLHGIEIYVPHNGIQELVVVWGIPGLVLFGWFMVEMFLQAKKHHKIRLINLLPLILVSVDVMFGQLIRSGTTLLALLMVYISLYVKFDTVGEYTYDDDKPAKRTVITKAIEYLKHPVKILTFLNSVGFGWLFSDKFAIKFTYYKRMGVLPNLDNPKTFNEKLNWLKLNLRSPDQTTKVDKVKVKELVANRIGEEYVIPLLATWDRAEDIDISSLPEQFVIKCNHAGGVFICKNKSEFNVDLIKKKVAKLLKKNYFYPSRCWPYKNVERKVFAEEFVKNNSSEENTDLIVYKVFVFNGRSKLIQVIQNDKTPNESIDYFNTNWDLLNIRQNYKNSEVHVEKPEVLDEMLKLSNKLSDKVPFVRVDWYIVDGKLKFSEFTYYSDSGFERFYPDEWDEKLGKLIKLPIDKVEIKG